MNFLEAILKLYSQNIEEIKRIETIIDVFNITFYLVSIITEVIVFRSQISLLKTLNEFAETLTTHEPKLHKGVKHYNKFSSITLMLLLIVGTVFIIEFKELQSVEARNEQIVDTTNNNLVLSVNTPDNWDSGIISQSISDLSWRLNGLDAFNGDMSAFFVVINSPSLTNIALPLGQKSGILSIILSQYVTINSEKDITLNDGSEAHLYSISVTADQLHRLMHL